MEESINQPQPTWLEVLRWIAVLPGAVAGALIAYWISRAFSWLASSRVGGDTWYEYILKEVLSNGVMGAAFVFCATIIAPRYQPTVACVAAGIILILSGAGFAFTLPTKEYISILALVCMNAGAIIIAIPITRGDI